MKKAPARKAFSSSGQPSFKWQLQEDAPSLAELLPEEEPARSPRRWMVLTACALLTLLIGFWGGQQLIQRAEANLEEVENEVAEVIQQQNIPHQPTTAVTNALLMPQPSGENDTNVTLLELNGALALVDLVVKHPQEAWYREPYRVARVMRQEAIGWKPIAPINAFWNDRRTLETTYFHLDYSVRDRRAVQEVAPLLDDFYVRLHSDLGIAAPTRNERMNILIAIVEGSDVRVTDLRYSGNTLIVPPPELLPRPLAISNAETLRQAIFFPLTAKLFDVAQNELPDACNWRAVREGIGLWLRWEGHTLPSRRHWEYQRVIDEWSNPAAPPRLDDLLSIPRDCWQPPPFLEMEVLNSGTPLPRAELAATLMEFTVMKYGRQFLPILLHEIGEFSSWEELAQATFDLSADELEEEWQRYLAARAP